MGRGSAEKVGASRKQFMLLEGSPILLHTVRKFAASQRVREIVVAVRSEDLEWARELLAGEFPEGRARVVEGGNSRQQSVANALATLAPDTDLVAVHDAVRPFVDAEIIGNVIQAAVRHGAAIAALPAIDTVKQVDRTADGAVVVSTLPRARVVMAQTPQGFRYDVLKKAFDDAQADGFQGTDEASLVERTGHEVAVVMGSPQNIKITTPADLELAEFFLAQEQRRR